MILCGKKANQDHQLLFTNIVILYTEKNKIMTVFSGLGDAISARTVFILTAPIQSGKTTSLTEWIRNKTNVAGILTPVINGKRVFQNIKTAEQFPMEAVPGESEVLTVGRFVFSRKNFNKAVEVIRNAINNPGWLVIDEIGPMELTGNGFSDILKEVLIRRNDKLLLVVRDKEDMTERVKQYFNLSNTVVIRSPEGLE